MTTDTDLFYFKLFPISLSQHSHHVIIHFPLLDHFSFCTSVTNFLLESQTLDKPVFMLVKLLYILLVYIFFIISIQANLYKLLGGLQ